MSSIRELIFAWFDLILHRVFRIKWKYINLVCFFHSTNLDYEEKSKTKFCQDSKLLNKKKRRKLSFVKLKFNSKWQGHFEHNYVHKFGRTSDIPKKTKNDLQAIQNETIENYLHQYDFYFPRQFIAKSAWNYSLSLVFYICWHAAAERAERAERASRKCRHRYNFEKPRNPAPAQKKNPIEMKMGLYIPLIYHWNRLFILSAKVIHFKSGLYSQIQYLFCLLFVWYKFRLFLNGPIWSAPNMLLGEVRRSKQVDCVAEMIS